MSPDGVPEIYTAAGGQEPGPGLDVLPEVSFDINLGRYVDYIDFDYAAYLAYLQERGVDNRDAVSTTIRFNSVPVNKVPNTKAHFDPFKNQIELNVIWRLSDENTSDHFIHETEHKIDFDTGRVKESEIWITRATQISRAVTKSMGALSVIGGVGALQDPNRLWIELSLESLATAVGCAVLGKVLYKLNPIEKRAWLAQENSSAQFIDVRLKPEDTF